ncbi:MAG: hypothetical protein ACTSW1_17580 [Candidatus Hodarchaeales archaeon]
MSNSHPVSIVTICPECGGHMKRKYHAQGGPNRYECQNMNCTLIYAKFSSIKQDWYGKVYQPSPRDGRFK